MSLFQVVERNGDKREGRHEERLCTLHMHGPQTLCPFPDADASVSQSGSTVRQRTLEYKLCTEMRTSILTINFKHCSTSMMLARCSQLKQTFHKFYL